MAEQSTFIKLDRNMLRWGWYTDGPTMRLFIHLILIANVKPTKWQDITIKRGQVVTSLHNLSRQTGLSVRSVRTALSHLISTNEVTSTSTNRYTLITVVNYALYQDKPTNKLTTERQTTDKQTTNNRQQYKNIKKDITNVISKNGKKEKECAAAQPPSARDWEQKIPKHLHGAFDSWEEYDEWRKSH